MSEDDPIPACCPICKHAECEDHLLARFDASGDLGAFGIGLTDGALCDVNEIEVVLQCVRLAWVQSVRATSKPKATRWIMKERVPSITSTLSVRLVSNSRAPRTMFDLTPDWAQVRVRSCFRLSSRLLFPPTASVGTLQTTPPSSCRGEPFQRHQAANVVGQVLQADLGARPHDANRSHDPTARRVLLRSEHMLDAAPIRLLAWFTRICAKDSG